GLVGNRGGTIFDKALKPTLGPGSVARETLAWWQKTFTEWQISDPKSIETPYIPAMKAMAATPSQYVFHPMTFHYFMRFANDPKDSPNPGKFNIFLQPGASIPPASVGHYSIFATTTSKAWSWELMQYLAGRDKNGKFTGPILSARFQSVTAWIQESLGDEEVKQTWGQWLGSGGTDLLLQQLKTAVDFTEIDPSMNEPWWPKWTDTMQAELQQCRQGKSPPDQACDALIRRAGEWTS